MLDNYLLSSIVKDMIYILEFNSLVKSQFSEHALSVGDFKHRLGRKITYEHIKSYPDNFFNFFRWNC